MADARLDTVWLRDERSSLQAGFVPAAGMLCCSLRDGDEELLAQNAGVAAYAQRGKTMGIPLLYPWANRLAGFEYGAAGRTVQVPHDPNRVALDANGLPIHGVIGGRMRWELTDESEDDGRLAGGPDQLEPLAGAAVRGLPVPSRGALSRAPARAVSADRGDRGGMRRGSGSGGIRLSPLSVACRTARASAGGSSCRRCASWHWTPARSRRARIRRCPPSASSWPSESTTMASISCRSRRIRRERREAPARARLRGGLPMRAGVRAPGRQFICFEPMTAPANALCSHRGSAHAGAGRALQRRLCAARNRAIGSSAPD